MQARACWVARRSIRAAVPEQGRRLTVARAPRIAFCAAGWLAQCVLHSAHKKRIPTAHRPAFPNLSPNLYLSETPLQNKFIPGRYKSKAEAKSPSRTRYGCFPSVLPARPESSSVLHSLACLTRHRTAARPDPFAFT